MIARVNQGDVKVQSDGRIRLPKTLLETLHITPGKDELEIYLDVGTEEIVISKKGGTEYEK